MRRASQMAAVRFLSQKEAQNLDKDLMSTCAFSIDQLMELAGLSVASAVHRFLDDDEKSTGLRVLVVCGPGNNGGDGLVAARHLCHFNKFKPTIVYPKPTKRELFQNLLTQCQDLNVEVMEQLPSKDQIDNEYSLVLDAIFGFSFSGDPRPPYDKILEVLKSTQTPIMSVDIPSGWHVEEGNVSGKGFDPAALVSLTAPKLCSKNFSGRKTFLIQSVMQ
eukprot:990291_1